jgi:carbamoyl-phosphate synthase small subunit
MKATLLLEDGFCLEGQSFGANGSTCAEVVFNTSMMGYQEILTDPSYKGQMVCMTYPLIGNYGVNPQDVESRRIWAEGFIVKEASQAFSNWRADKSLDQYLKENKIVAIEGIDTRSLTKHLREKGAMKGVIASGEQDLKKMKIVMDKTPSIIGIDLSKEVSCDKIYDWDEDLGIRRIQEVKKTGYRIVAIDCGIKYSILRNLAERFEKVTVVPANTPLKEIMKLKPDGLLFSNGPGDPEAVVDVIETAKETIEGLKSKKLKIAVMGICLGHQILGIAFGGKSQKLKFGHHGGNHPVKDIETGRVDITSQNHNFIIPPETIPEEGLYQTHVNLYDKTAEGCAHRKLPLFSVQYHPEAGPGPFDSRNIFGKFVDLIKKL